MWPTKEAIESCPCSSTDATRVDGSLLACDAGTQRACVSSMGMATGMHTFPALPGGRYHLVVDADQPGKEGGVVLQFSAVATPTP